MKKTILNNKYDKWRDFVDTIPGTFSTTGEYVYGGRRNLIKRFVAPDGTRLIVKRFRKPNIINDIVYSTGLREAKGLRAFRYPAILRAKGINTPDTVAYIEFRRCGLIQLSYLISIESRCTHRMYETVKMNDEESTAMAKQLALFTAHMHTEGVMHLDYSPGNILWESKDGRCTFSLVDINRMFFGNVTQKMGCKNFRRLWGSTLFMTTLAQEYARCRNMNAEECVEETLRQWHRFWDKRHRKGCTDNICDTEKKE